MRQLHENVLRNVCHMGKRTELGYQTLRKNVHLKTGVEMYEYDMNFTSYDIF
jgi:hypothetical protein